jgi:hypothetical protein
VNKNAELLRKILIIQAKKAENPYSERNSKLFKRPNMIPYIRS